MKYLEGLRKKYPTSIPIKLMTGNMLSLAGYSLEALGEYFQVYKLLPEEPLVLMLIGNSEDLCSSLSNMSSSSDKPPKHRHG